jgi:hypothetical protein
MRLYDEKYKCDRSYVINMIAKFLYHYPNIDLKDVDNNTLLYKNLITKKKLSNDEERILDIYKNDI